MKQSQTDILIEWFKDISKVLQYKRDDGKWYVINVGNPIEYLIKYEIRIKPAHIKIGDVYITAPESKPPKNNTIYYCPSFLSSSNYATFTWTNYTSDVKYLNMGIVFLNKEDAISSAEALLSNIAKGTA